MSTWRNQTNYTDYSLNGLADPAESRRNTHNTADICLPASDGLALEKGVAGLLTFDGKRALGSAMRTGSTGLSPEARGKMQWYAASSGKQLYDLVAELL